MSSIRLIDFLWSGWMFLIHLGRFTAVITIPAESVSEVLNYRDVRTFQSDGQSYSLSRAYKQSLDRNQSSDRVL